MKKSYWYAMEKPEYITETFDAHHKLDIPIVWTQTLNGAMPWSPAYRVEEAFKKLREEIESLEIQLSNADEEYLHPRY